MTDEDRLKRIKDYDENVRKCCPCDYCNNPKHLTSFVRNMSVMDIQDLNLNRTHHHMCWTK